MQPEDKKKRLAPFETAMVLPERTRAGAAAPAPSGLELDELDQKIARLKRTKGEDEGLFDRNTPSL